MTGSIDAGRMASEANVSNLILVHEGYNLTSPKKFEEAIRGIKKIYSGNVIQSEEKKTYNLTK